MYSYGHGQIISEWQSYLVDTDGNGLEGLIQRVGSAQLDPISLHLQLKTQRLPISYAFVDCPICTSTIRELHVPAVRVGELTMDIL